MDKEELDLRILQEDTLNKIGKMIEKEEIQLKNACILLKHVGYCMVLKEIDYECFRKSSLRYEFEKMIFKEYGKKDEKNEMLLVDLCECYLLFHGRNLRKELLLICLRCLLKAALNKEESKEAQRNVEIALLAMSNINSGEIIGKELYLNEIKEIIEYHQRNCNLTHLAYQSAWSFLFCRLFANSKLLDDFVNILHFAREATRELSALRRKVDWKASRKELKHMKNAIIVKRWCKLSLSAIIYLQRGEVAELIECVVSVCKSANNKRRDIIKEFISTIEELMITTRESSIILLLRGGVIGVILEDISQTTTKKEEIFNFLKFIFHFTLRLKGITKDEGDIEICKTIKSETIVKLEEGGYEDMIISFYTTFILYSSTIPTKKLLYYFALP
ncbi:uncharacterized protein MONOS_18639 [Monocercomonoides exilis]|uniref:uncharacterized protein n=1 Tax=Monocercomonoides exilis TaxID=2049356 RepID=UPI003559A252|nr:hypothetical protein MONOS_18639 [Monocercomonoides exilis]